MLGGFLGRRHYVLVVAHNGAVDQRIFLVGIGRQIAKDPVPDTSFRPMTDTCVKGGGSTKALGQIPPWHTSAVTVHPHVKKQPAFLRRHAHIARFAG